MPVRVCGSFFAGNFQVRKARLYMGCGRFSLLEFVT